MIQNTLALSPAGSVRRPGRRPVSGDPAQRARHIECARLMLATNWPVKRIARSLGISRSRAYDWLAMALSYPEADDLRQLAKDRPN